MTKLIARLWLLVLLACFAPEAFAQSSPGLVFGQVPTAPQWNSYFAAKQDVLIAGANTVYGNPSALGTYPSFMSMPDCHATSSALIWTPDTGFGCQSIAGTITGPVSSTSGYIPTWLGTTGNQLGAGLAAPTGALVGTTDTQTLTNKSIVATQLTGTVPCAQTPALTGDVTKPAGSCVTTIAAASVTGVSNSDGTLTISPTSGAVVASLALSHANTWTGVQSLQDGSGNALFKNDATTKNAQIGHGVALATGATTGFANLPATAGVPTGSSANCTAALPCLVVDTTDGRLYANYSGAASWTNLSAGGGGGGVTGVTAGAGLTTTLGSTGGTISSTGTLSTIRPVNAQTGTTYTVVDGDQSKLVTYSNASAVAVTLPQAGAAASFLTGWWSYHENKGAGTVTITPTTSTIDGAASITLAQNQGVILVSDGTNYVTMRGRGLTGITAGTGITVTGSTFSPTVAITSPVGPTVGGTGLTGGVSGGVLYWSSASVLASSGALTANLPVFGGGAGSPPVPGTRSGNTTQVATVSGSLTTNNCLKADASGNVVDNGSTCGGGGSSDFSKIATATAGVSSSLDFTSYGTTYDTIFINCRALILSNTTNLALRFAQGVTPTWNSSGEYTSTGIFLNGPSGSVTASGASGATSITLTHGNVNNAATSMPISVKAWFNDITGTTDYKSVDYEVSYGVPGSLTLTTVKGSGVLYTSNTDPITGIRFIPLVGTITTGKCTAYGITN